MINSTLLKTTKQLTSEMNRIREEYSNIFKNMKQEIEVEKQNIQKLRSETFQERQKYEMLQKQLQTQYNDEIERLKKENEQRNQQQEKKFKQMKEDYEQNI